MKEQVVISLGMGVVLWGLVPVMMAAQPAPIPFFKQPYFLHSGFHSSTLDPSEGGHEMVFKHKVRIPEAAWLWLQFGEVNLGERSFMTITSLEDWSQQRHTAKTLAEWRNSTAFFNGDAVEVKLFVAAGEQNIFFELVEVSVGEFYSNLPREFDLAQNYPNPFSTKTAIGYTLQEDVQVTLRVYNLLGQKVVTLVDAFEKEGIKFVVWDGRNAAGGAVSNGTYLYRLTAGEFVQTIVRAVFALRLPTLEIGPI